MDITLVRNIAYLIIAVASAISAVKFYRVPNGEIRKLLIYDQASMAIFFIFAILQTMLAAWGMEVLGNFLLIPIGLNLALSSVLLLVFMNRK